MLTQSRDYSSDVPTANDVPGTKERWRTVFCRDISRSVVDSLTIAPEPIELFFAQRVAALVQRT